LQIDKTFGFESAVEEAQKAILAAKVRCCCRCWLLDMMDCYNRRPSWLQLGRTLQLLAVPLNWHGLVLLQVEASSAYRGIGMIKLMGRQSGFITVAVRGQAGRRRE